MKMPLYLAALLLATGTCQAEPFPEEIIQYIDNTRVVAFIDADIITQAGTWSPLEAPPPLPLATALEAVKTAMGNDPRLHQASLKDLKLQAIPHHAGRWNYVFRLTTEYHDHREDHYLVVLMNGQVVSAVGEPDSVK